MCLQNNNNVQLVNTVPISSEGRQETSKPRPLTTEVMMFFGKIFFVFAHNVAI